MKKIIAIFFLSFVLFPFQLFAQTSNEIGVYYGFSTCGFFQNPSLVGTGSVFVDNNHEMGLKYLKPIGDRFSVELGINYFKADFTINAAPMVPEIPSRHEKFEMLSFPINAHYAFGEYFYVHAGPIVDIQTTENTVDSQSGIGLGMGFGGKYSLDSFVIFVNPNFKIHRFIAFEKEKYPKKLNELGVQFGVGYKF